MYAVASKVVVDRYVRGFNLWPWDKLFLRIVALARVTWLCVRGLGRLTILRLPACVSTFEAYVKSLRSREGLVRSVKTVWVRSFWRFPHSL